MADLMLNGKVAIVTGAGSGIGEAISIVLANEGVKVILADLVEEKSEKVAEKIKNLGGEAYPIKVDVSDHSMVKGLFDSALKKYRRVDILVTAAGISARGRVEEITDESWEKTIAINLTGTFFCVQEAVKIMKKQGEGKIVTISSDTAKRGGGRSGGAGSSYAASKAGVIALTKTVAIELRDYPDIYLNCICPGPTDTPMHKNMTLEERQKIIKEIPKGRYARPEEIANAVLFLVSELSTFVYAETLNVDGGVIRE